MKKTKKILSLVLVVMMLLSTIPTLEVCAIKCKTGDLISFGSYPQSEVKDKTLIAELNAFSPNWESWTSYGYYSGSGDYGSMKQGDWMRYTDVTYNGNKYRGVKFTQYRPYSTISNVAQGQPTQKNNGFLTDTIYWFSFDPIDWRILDPTTGLVLCETIIDSQPYCNTVYWNNNADAPQYFNDTLYTNRANDYETSSIRTWLNNDFYNTAFTDSQKLKINFNEKNDKIFLPSYADVINSDYGFDPHFACEDTTRRAQGSDYAKCQNLDVAIVSDITYNGNSGWVILSDGAYDCYCNVISIGGATSVYNDVCHIYGIRPALNLSDLTQFEINEDKCTHKIFRIEGKIAPTCTEAGYTGTKICNVCNETIKIGSELPSTGHYFINYICLYCNIYCSCDCHKDGWFAKLIWNITLFFQRIFGTNRTCFCGIAHY